MVTEYTKDEFMEMFRKHAGDFLAPGAAMEDDPDTRQWYVATIIQMNRWLERDDGIAVYENHDMGHADLGEKQFTSYGSPQAQLEVPEPPERLPDIGGRINWRYTLIGTYKGEALPTDAT